MGYVSSSQTVFNENLPQTFRHLSCHREQLLWILPLHTCCNHLEVLEEIQKDGILRDDDIPTEHADQGVG
jgi:hypothetical protein